jgi:hypothetical protein
MSADDSSDPGQPLVFGVPGTEVAAALRSAGLDEDAVVAVLGRAYAQSLAPAAAAAAPAFTFQVSIAETAPECALTYQRVFVHPDFIDGVTVVQAGQTADEIGFNARFHALESEFDSISRDLHTSSNCVAELRLELFRLARELEVKITQIEAQIAAKGKDKDSKDTKEKDTKETKDKDTKEKDTKEGKDKEGKDTKEKEKEHKDKDKDHDKIAAGIEKAAGIDQIPLVGTAAGQPPAEDEPVTGTERTFIALEDRPDVEAAALGPAEAPPPAKKAAKKAPAKKAPAKKAPAKKAPAKKARPAEE